MTTSSRIFDDLGRLMNDAAGVADGVRREVETVIKSQAERFVADFDAMRELVQAQGEEIARLRRELEELQALQQQQAT